MRTHPETRHTDALPGAAYVYPSPMSSHDLRIAAARENVGTWRQRLAELNLAVVLMHEADESLADYLTAVVFRLQGAVDQLRRIEGRR